MSNPEMKSDLVPDLYLVTQKAKPAYTISGIEASKNPFVVEQKVFISQEDAKKYVALRKKVNKELGKDRSFRVQKITSSTIKSTYFHPTDHTLNFKIEHEGHLMNNFKTIIHTVTVCRLNEDKLELVKFSPDTKLTISTYNNRNQHRFGHTPLSLFTL